MNVYTVAQLSDCTKTDLLSVCSIGITRLDQIDTELSPFLIGLLPDAERKLAIRLSGESNVRLQLADHDLSQQRAP